MATKFTIISSKDSKNKKDEDIEIKVWLEKGECGVYLMMDPGSGNEQSVILIKPDGEFRFNPLYNEKLIKALNINTGSTPKIIVP